MKKTHIILIILSVVAIGVVISVFGNAGQYADFAKAQSLPQNEFQIIGKLVKDKPVNNENNGFSFFMTDEKGKESKVMYKGIKPRDFEKSEQVVISGHAEIDYFKASSMLLKCPSKYNENKLPQQFDKKEFK